jgi:hypothetical protein
MTTIGTNQVAFVDAGALDVIFDSMHRFAIDQHFQLKACEALHNLAAARENCGVFLKMGTVEHLMDIFDRCSDNPAVLAEGFFTIRNLATHDMSVREEIIDLAGSVVNAMAIHTHDPSVHGAGLKALRCLSAQSSNNKIKLVECFGVIDITIGALQVHRDEAEVQAEGAWLLSNLAGIGDNDDVIGESGGIDVMVRALWLFSEDEVVKDRCAQGIYALCASSPLNRSILLEIDGDTAVINAMMGHVECPSLQISCCDILFSLCHDSDDTKMRIVDKECLDAVAIAMVTHNVDGHQEDGRVQAAACQLLSALAIEANYEAIMASQVVHLVEIATAKFPQQCEIPSHSLLASWISQSS